METGRLEIDGVSAGYGARRVVNDASLEVHAGTIVLLVGGNGSGKSTLLKAVVGDADIQGGKIWLDGREFSPRRTILDRRDELGYLPQGGGIFLQLSVEENFLLLLGRKRTNHNDATREALEDLFPIIRAKWKVRSVEMSGGERQQVAIALALVRNPAILLLDEPSIGLGPNLVPLVLGKVGEIKEKFGASILLVEQRVSDALGIADYVYGLREGRVVLGSPANTIAANPGLLGPVFFGDETGSAMTSEKQSGS